MENLKALPIPRSDLPAKSSGSDLAPASLAASRTALLFGCYRKGDANDPEIYTMAIAATLAEYQKEVIEYVTDPRTGLPARLKWLPTVAEVREACEDHGKFLKAQVELLRKGYRYGPDGRLIRPGE